MTTSDLTAQRTARARAFIRQERAKWQRSWADLTYEYDREQITDSPNGQKEREHDHAELNDRMDRPHV